MAKPLKGSLGHKMNGFDHLPFVPGIWHVVEDPHVRNALLLLEWEGEAPASTPLPNAPSVYHSANKCMAAHNQPVGQGWVQALTAAAVRERDAA